MKKHFTQIKAGITTMVITTILIVIALSIDYALADSSMVSDENIAAEVMLNQQNEHGFHINQITKKGYEELFTASFPIDYATKTFPLPCQDNTLILRIDHTGLPYAGIEQLQLTTDEKIIQPLYACFEDTGQNTLDDLLYDDFNVAVAYQHPIEIAWDLSDYPTDTSYSLLMKANEYPKGKPLPWGGGIYQLGTHYRTNTIDGRLDDPTLTPMYSPVWQPDSGHPDGITNVYICEDEQFVYFSFDITCDNTNDIGEDWFELIIDDKVFHVDDEHTEYGTMGFGKTDAVSYHHQFVELGIPKDELPEDIIYFSTLFYGTVSVFPDGYSDDVDLGTQYIIPEEHKPGGNHFVVQEVDLQNMNNKYDLRIDSFNIRSTGSAVNNRFDSLKLWVDGGNGYYDGGGVSSRTDDEQIGSTIYNPDLEGGEIIGVDDNKACLTIPNKDEKKVFVTVDIDDSVRINDETIRTRLNAGDIVDFSSVSWNPGPSPPRTLEGIETASSRTYIFSYATPIGLTADDANDNGIIDKIIVNTEYLIGNAIAVWHNTNEETSINQFAVEYQYNDLDIEAIELHDSNATEAAFALILDESDTDLSVDTSTTDFTVSYDYTNEELWLMRSGLRKVPVWPVMSYWDVEDTAGPVVTSLTISDTLITEDDAGDSFEIILNFSEPMNLSTFPVLDFDDAIHQGSSKTLVFDSQYMVDEDTYQINYTIADGDEYAKNVDVICTTTETLDAQGVMMNSSYIRADLLTVDTKAPDIYGFPTDTLTPGEDYTIRVYVSDDSDIQNVLLDYNFGSSWNTKTMSYDPGSGEYFVVVTPPMTATTMSYKISAFDTHDNGDETIVKELTIGSEEDEEEEDEEEEEEPEEETDTDEDGYSDDMEESYGTNATDADDYPLDTDEDGTPDDDSGDGNYTGDTDDDDDGLLDETEDDIGSDSKNNDDVTTTDNIPGYLVDTDDDGDPDTYVDDTTENTTNITTNENGEYEIDVDGDGSIDYVYDATAGTTTPNEQENTGDSTPGFTISFVFIAIAAMIIISLIFIRRPRL